MLEQNVKMTEAAKEKQNKWLDLFDQVQAVRVEQGWYSVECQSIQEREERWT